METDDRLVGDPVWELFPPAPVPVPPGRRFLARARILALVAGAWALFPPLAVVFACLAVSFRDLRAGWQTNLPDKAGGRICALFAYAWGAWKLGCTAFGMMFVVVAVLAIEGKPGEMPPAFAVALLLWFAASAASAVLTANGLVLAYRSGMRVWIGEGINRARTLLLGMLLVGFTCLVLMPASLLLSVRGPGAGGGTQSAGYFMLGLCFLMFGAPVILLVLLDWFTRRIVAATPGKFGPKVPAVGKWEGFKFRGNPRGALGRSARGRWVGRAGS